MKNIHVTGGAGCIGLHIYSLLGWKAMRDVDAMCRDTRRWQQNSGSV